MDIFIAVIIDLIIGDPYWFPHPIIYMGKLISFLEKIGRAITKSNRGLKIFGGFIVIIVALVCFLVPFIILKLSNFNYYLFHFLNIIIIWTTLASRCLHTETIKIYYALGKNDIEDARVKLSYLVGRETSELNEKEIIRATVETISENTSDGVIAPMFYAILGGAPLAMLYKGINTMDSMVGYMNEKYRFIGYFPAKIDDLFNLIPARITGVFIAISAPIVGGNIFEALKIMFRDRKNHKSPNCAYPEGAAAGALKVQLGGTNTYFGEVVFKPTIGDKKRSLEKKDIIKVIWLMYCAEFISLFLYLAVFKW